MDYCEEDCCLLASLFISAAGKGCLTCKLVRAAVETFILDPEQRDSCSVGLVGGLCLYVGPSKTRMLIDVYCLPSAICPWDDGIDRKNYLSGSTASLDSWSQAKQWLRICADEHDKCLPRAEALPTRLLDLNVKSSHIKLLDVSESKVAESMSAFLRSVVMLVGLIGSGCRNNKLSICLFKSLLGHDWTLSHS